MELLIVAQRDLTRAGTRILTVLQAAYRATLLNPQQLAAPPPSGAQVGTLFIGDLPTSRALQAQHSPRWSNHGVQFGFAGHQAWILAEPVPDPEDSLQAIGWALAELTDAAEAALLRRQATQAEPLTGLHLAGMYLDPQLRVPAETVRGPVDFSPARMCWERQYTFGIARFLADGLDAFIEAPR